MLTSWAIPVAHSSRNVQVSLRSLRRLHSTAFSCFSNGQNTNAAPAMCLIPLVHLYYPWGRRHHRGSIFSVMRGGRMLDRRIGTSEGYIILHPHMLHGAGILWKIHQHLAHTWPSFVGFIFHGASGIHTIHSPLKTPRSRPCSLGAHPAVVGEGPPTWCWAPSERPPAMPPVAIRMKYIRQLKKR